MTRDEFCKLHWRYYLSLEKDFLGIERYVMFDLGDNFLYANNTSKNLGNSECFSVEFIKQYQSICSEVDVILKTICKEINKNSTADSMRDYSREVLNKWPTIVDQKVRVKGMELQPFIGWKSRIYWWSKYNEVKHHRIENENYKNANLKNTLNALAGLYILEQYLVKFIGDRDNEIDVPDDVSELFEMVNWNTRHHVFGRNAYMYTNQDIDELFSKI